MTAWTIRLAVLLGLGFATLAPPAGAQDTQPGPVRITFVLAGDIDSIETDETRGGFARLAGLVTREKAAAPNVLFVHAGDTISPSLLSGFDQGRHVIDLLNMFPPDIFVPGNHEFDFGPDVFLQRMSEVRFPVLSANLGAPDGGRVPGVGTSLLKEIDGVRIGFVGLTSDHTYVKASTEDLRIADLAQTLRSEAAVLRERGADLVVAVVHADNDEDEALLRTRAADVILSGDDHDLKLFYDGRTLLAESMAQAEYVTIVDLTITVREREGARTVAWTPGFRVVDTATVEPDPEVSARIVDLETQLSAELDAGLGETAIALDSRRAVVRTAEAAIGNLVADAMRTATGSDIAITNGGGIRGDRLYAPGDAMTRRDVLAELPFGNKTVVIELTGAQIREALENGVSDTESVSGRFPHVSGLRFAADLSRPPGSRVLEVEADGEALDPQAVYTVATNDFMLRGGDGYDVFAAGKVLVDGRDGNLMASEVMAYIRAKGTEGSAVSGRITLR